MVSDMTVQWFEVVNKIATFSRFTAVSDEDNDLEIILSSLKIPKALNELKSMTTYSVR